jgi:hypothetical protein
LGKAGADMTEEIMTYVKGKTYFREKLESKFWDWNGERIEVISLSSEPYILIRAY